jgi:hypothetical protein
MNITLNVLDHSGPLFCSDVMNARFQYVLFFNLLLQSFYQLPINVITDEKFYILSRWKTALMGH